jgi:hypothetical protein
MPTQTTNTSTNSTQTTNKVEITDWKLRLANYDNLLPEDFEVELANIDNSKDPKQFDARAVKYLKEAEYLVFSIGVNKFTTNKDEIYFIIKGIETSNKNKNYNKNYEWLNSIKDSLKKLDGNVNIKQGLNSGYTFMLSIPLKNK